MFRLKNFLAKKVVYANGKKIGTVIDIAINFSEKKVIGFAIKGINLFGKKISWF